MTRRLKFRINALYDPTSTSLDIEIFKEEVFLAKNSGKLTEISGENDRLLWILHCCKDIFDEDLEETEVDITCTEAHYERRTLADYFNELLTIFKNTKAWIRKLKNLKNHKTEYSGKLFYNVDESVDFKNIYNHFASVESDIFYINSNSGWNAHLRSWGENTFYSLEDLFLIIIRNKVSQVISTNNYYLTHILHSEKVNLISLFKNLGFKFISIDYDVYNLSPASRYIKSIFSLSNNKRFSIWPHIEKSWDDFLKLKDISYVLVNNFENKQSRNSRNTRKNKLIDNYGIVVMSHSRLLEYHSLFPKAYFFLENISFENQYAEYLMLYFALIDFIQTSDLSLLIKLQQTSALTSLLHASISLLKYDAIETASSIKNLIIFGDQCWKSLFPELYQNKYLPHTEQETFFEKKEHLYLLLNENYSYTATNPSVLKALEFDIPFLNFTSLVKSKTLKGMQHVEYNNNEILKNKIGNINLLFEQEDLKESIHNLKRDLKLSIDNFYSNIFKKNFIDNFYESLCLEDSISFKASLDEYKNNHTIKIQHCYETLFLGKQTQFSLRDSRYHTRNYFKRMFKID